MINSEKKIIFPQYLDKGYIMPGGWGSEEKKLVQGLVAALASPRLTARWALLAEFLTFSDVTYHVIQALADRVAQVCIQVENVLRV